MKPTDFAKGQIWAIPPERFEALAVQLKQFVPPAETLSLQMLQGLAQAKPYEVVNGVAVVPLMGTLLPRADFIDRLLGGGGLENFTQALAEGIRDPEVAAFVVDVDSPGGKVIGTVAAAEFVSAVSGIKPVVALASGDMMSAAYWIGSAADQVVISKTSNVGSIGVLMLHVDLSELDQKIGVKKTYLTAGHYKRMGADNEPLNSEARDYFQAMLDHTYGVFVEAVAVNRGVSIETVLKDMADGRVFIGQQAIDAGLADRLGNMDDAIQLARALADQATTNNIKRGGSNMSGENQITTMEALSAAYPDLTKALGDKAAAGVDVAGARAEASQKSRTDLLALVEAVFGQEAGTRFKAVVESGVTAEQYRAIQAVQPKQVSDADVALKGKAEILKHIQAAGAPDPGTGGAVGPAGEQDYETLVKAEQAKGKSLAEATRFVTSNFPQAHAAWLAKQEPKQRAA